MKQRTMTQGNTKNRIRLMASLSAATLLLLFVAACHKENEPDVPVEHTLLVYMGGDNNLSWETQQKAEEMRKGWSARPQGRLLIYADPADGAPTLSEVVKSNTGNKLQTLTVYDEENSASGEVLHRVIEDVRQLSPSPSYGLLVFSHASGWLPRGTLTQPRSIIQDDTPDYKSEMELVDFANAIPNGAFDYIVFETCFSAGIEVAYELRNKTKRILASAAEIVSPGFTPIYAHAIDYLFDADSGLEKFAQAAFDYQNTQSGYQSATFSIIDTGGLDNLAAFVKQHCNFTTAVATGSVQHFDRYSYRLFFDFTDYYSRLLATDSQRQQLAQLAGNCVRWKAATPYFLQNWNGFEIKQHAGITTYIRQERFPQLNEAYATTGWGRATGQ